MRTGTRAQVRQRGWANQVKAKTFPPQRGNGGEVVLQDNKEILNKNHRFKVCFDSFKGVSSPGDKMSDVPRGTLVPPSPRPLRHSPDYESNVLPVTELVQSPCTPTPAGDGGRRRGAGNQVQDSSGAQQYLPEVNPGVDIKEWWHNRMNHLKNIRVPVSPGPTGRAHAGLRQLLWSRRYPRLPQARPGQ